MRMGRRRTKNRHLPAGVSLERGRYYFRSGKAPRLNLGREFGEAMRQYGALFTEQGLATFGAVRDRYLQSPDFARISERSRTDYMRYLVKIREKFGAVPPRRITAPDVLKFRDLIWKKSGMVQANRHLELLKLLLRLATAWGVIPV